MKSIKISLLFLLLASGGIMAQNDCSGLLTDTLYANITALQSNDTINAYIDKNWFVILDVRTPSEYNGQHLYEDVNLDFYSSTFAADLAALDRSKVYLIHCASGSRSGQVFTQMQNLHFRRVYNMISGMSAWNTAGLPTTTTVAPLVGVCDTNVSFVNTTLGNTDSLLVTITNAANSVLSITNITDLSGSVFSSDLNVATTLKGGCDNSFYVYYTPDDLYADSIIFDVVTNGGTLEFILHGTVYDPTGIYLPESNSIAVVNDAYNQKIIVTNNTRTVQKCELYNSSGVMINSSVVTDVKNISYSEIKQGIYILRIYSSKESRTYKLLLM
jgi:rhodanese-related sulfurtransferase